MKIVADIHIPHVQDYFGVYGDLILRPGRAISAKDIKDADILLVRSVTVVDEHLLENSRVRFVGSVTAGTDHIDFLALKKKNIQVASAVGFNAPPVADYVVSVIAALQKQSLLTKPNKRAAVIGVGRVGSLVVERLKALHFDVTLCDPFLHGESFYSTPLDALSEFDLVTLHVPLTKVGLHPTYHFITENFLARQNKDCVLINSSRGSVIDTEVFLKKNHSLHLCLDVWEHEPKINQDLLARTLIATPHIAGYSIQSKIRGIDTIYRIACDKNIIEPQSVKPILIPHDTVILSNQHIHWQDVVLEVFNPLNMTQEMKEKILKHDNTGAIFDELRNQFNYRHELHYSDFIERHQVLTLQDYQILTSLGLSLKS